MATRATISIVKEDGSTSSIYNHYDGYKSSLGKELKTHFTNEEDILSLMSRGGIRGIYNGVIDSFEDDRIDTFNNQDKLKRYIRKCGFTYNYVFKNNAWEMWS
jgi:hypothetical protein